MRVCFVSHEASLGGAERALLELLLAFRSKGTESSVVLPRKGPLLEELKRLGIPCVVTRYYYWMGARTVLWKRLGAILVSAVGAIPVMLWVLKWKADLVCTNSIVVFAGALAAWTCRKPHVWFIHEFVDESYGFVPYLPFSLTMRLVDISSSLILTASKTIRQGYARYLPQSKMHTIHQAALPPTSLNYQNTSFEHGSGFNCVSLGALYPGKGHSDAVRAIGNLSKRGLLVYLTIIGGRGPDQVSLQALVRAEGVQERVFFAGFLPNPLSVMSSADAVLVCSRNEGFGRVAVEAMRLGKPVVAASSGATLELIEDGFNGLLYPPGDHEQLAEKLLMLLKSPRLRSELGEKGRHSVERFSLETYGAEAARCFNQVLRHD